MREIDGRQSDVFATVLLTQQASSCNGVDDKEITIFQQKKLLSFCKRCKHVVKAERETTKQYTSCKLPYVEANVEGAKGAMADMGALFSGCFGAA